MDGRTIQNILPLATAVAMIQVKTINLQLQN